MIISTRFRIPFVMMAILLIFPLIFSTPVHLAGDSGKVKEKIDYNKIEEDVLEMMDEGGIPGLVLVILKEGEPDYIKGFGLADMSKDIPVTNDTLLEIGSCSKAFTALAAVQLEDRGLLNLDDPVSNYLPWFEVKYDGEPRVLTIRQCLHQTGGLPWNAITKIPQSDDDKALEQTVKNISGMELRTEPGKEFHYSTVNYDIVGAVIEKVSGVSYETYVTENILKPLDLKHTIVGVDQSNPPAGLSTGYKIGFFSPRPYTAPVFRGNNPAGYIVSNGKDIARWLKFQTGIAETPLAHLIEKTQQPDLSVEPNTATMNSYAMGWFVNPYGVGSVSHSGYNPNFTSYLNMSPKEKVAVGVLSNSNSLHSGFIANVVYNRMFGREIDRQLAPGGGMDKGISVVSIMVMIFLLGTAVFLLILVLDIIKGNRSFDGLSLQKLKQIFVVLLMNGPFLIAIYLLPKAMMDVNWEMALVWGPPSFTAAIYLIIAAMALSFFTYVMSSLFPHKNKYVRSAPSLIVLSLLTGGANAVVIFLVTGSIYVKQNVEYMVFYFLLVVILYITGRKIVQTELVKITQEIVFDLRMRLIGKIFYTSFQRFERVEEGKVLATLNNDTGQIGNSANLVVALVSSIVTVIGVFIYLATIAFWATAVTVAVIIVIATVYYFVSDKAQEYMEQARDEQNIYMELLDGLVDGFKELSLHIKKKLNYKNDLETSCNTFRNKTVLGSVKLINAFLVGESLLVLVLGAVGFGVPRVFPAIQNVTLMSFIIALLYLIGPINQLLNSIPGILMISVSWGRVKHFIEEIPANMDPEDEEKPLVVEKSKVKFLEASKLFFEYKPVDTDEPEKVPVLAKGDTETSEKAGSAVVPQDISQPEKLFAVGPLNLKAEKGEIIFIVGGNGSGKTTLAKLLTGLYTADDGTVTINGEAIPNYQLGEYFSVVFGGFHLFKKLYEMDLDDREDEIKKYLQLLEMDGKVEIIDNSFNTIDLSGGQRKRLALLQCYLEDSPVYLFDEVAADQDPQFRKFFYRTLLTDMKKAGKIVIAITHDDHYFDVADKVIKMDMGQIDYVSKGEELAVTR